MGFFVCQGIPEEPGNVMVFFHQGCQVFKFIILITYLLDNRLGQDIKRSQVSH